MRYSRRLDWAAPPNTLASLLDEKRAANAKLLDLTVSNPTRVGLPYPTDAIARALADPRAATYDPTPQGLPEARRAVADYYAAHGDEVNPEHLLLTASTSEAYALLFKLLCDPGDCVLVPRPSYPLFDFLSALEGVALADYPLSFDGAWHLDRAALEDALDRAEAAHPGRVRALLAVSPNNPTGSFLKRDERALLASLCRERDLALIVDEVFADYAFAPDPRRAPSMVSEREALCFTLSGCSKVLGLPQLKLGWVHVSGPDEERGRALARLELVADTYLSVGASAQLALPALLPLRDEIGGAILARCRQNLATLRERTMGTACQALPVEGGWYATLRLPAVQSDEAWALSLLAHDDVLVQPGYFYDLPSEAHVVVSLLCDPASFEEGLRRLLARAG